MRRSRESKTTGWTVVLTPTGPFPKWASRSGRSNLKYPKPRLFRDWIYSLARRYSGNFEVYGRNLPNVGRWAIWNEPNLHTFLKPQFKNGKPYSPKLYRRLFLAAQAGLRASGSGGDQVLIGETATTQRPRRDQPGPVPARHVVPQPAVRAGRQLRADRRRRLEPPPIRLQLRSAREVRNPGMIHMRRIGRLTRALGLAARAGATERRLDVFITEYGILSKPKYFGVSLTQQAGYMAISEYLAWRNPHVRGYGQYLLHDDPLEYESAFTTGLRFAGGRQKAELPLLPDHVAAEAGGRRGVLLWGYVRAVERPRPASRCGSRTRASARGCCGGCAQTGPATSCSTTATATGGAGLPACGSAAAASRARASGRYRLPSSLGRNPEPRS